MFWRVYHIQQGCKFLKPNFNLPLFEINYISVNYVHNWLKLNIKCIYIPEHPNIDAVGSVCPWAPFLLVWFVCASLLSCTGCCFLSPSSRFSTEDVHDIAEQPSHSLPWFLAVFPPNVWVVGAITPLLMTKESRVHLYLAHVFFKSFGEICRTALDIVLFITPLCFSIYSYCVNTPLFCLNSSHIDGGRECMSLRTLVCTKDLRVRYDQKWSPHTGPLTLVSSRLSPHNEKKTKKKTTKKKQKKTSFWFFNIITHNFAMYICTHRI